MTLLPIHNNIDATIAAPGEWRGRGVFSRKPAETAFVASTDLDRRGSNTYV
jgi:hypothetical protein